MLQLLLKELLIVIFYFFIFLLADICKPICVTPEDQKDVMIKKQRSKAQQHSFSSLPVLFASILMDIITSVFGITSHCIFVTLYHRYQEYGYSQWLSSLVCVSC